MIHSDPTISRNTISTPNASANTLLKLSGAGGDVQEEDEVNAHLRDRQHHQCNRNAGLPDQRRTGDEERNDCDQRRQPKADQIAANAFGDLAAVGRLVAGSQVAFMQMQTDFGVAHRANPIR